MAGCGEKSTRQAHEERAVRAGLAPRALLSGVELLQECCSLPTSIWN